MYCEAWHAWPSWRASYPAVTLDRSVWPDGHDSSTAAPELTSSVQLPAILLPPGHDWDDMFRTAQDLSSHVAPLGQLAHVDEALVTTA